MIKNYEWTDVDLTALAVASSLGSISLELSSTYNGSTLAEIFCTGILAIQIQSALAPNEAILPVLASRVAVNLIPQEEVEQVLTSAGYGFRFAGNFILPCNVRQVFHVAVEGGEIDAEIIALSCEVSEKATR